MPTHASPDRTQGTQPRREPLIGDAALARARELRDLTDPARGPHAMQLLLGRIQHALALRWGCDQLVHRADPVVTRADNYDRLHYPADGAARDARYSRYVAPGRLLRTQTSAMIPGLLEQLAHDPPRDVLLVCPGLVYRRDSIDRLHTGEPHQVDLWRIAAVNEERLDVAHLAEMVGAVVAAALPGWRYRTVPAAHPYTTNGVQVDVWRAEPEAAAGRSDAEAGDDRADGEWVEVGECGLALPAILEEAGLDPARYRGLAMGLGLDRLLMLAKGLDDIRLLRAADPRIARQMLDLSPYQPVSRQPAVRRDLSVMVDRPLDAEAVGDRIREALGDDAGLVESVEVLGSTPAELLPAAAVARMGARPGQTNLLVRLVIRDVARTLTAAEANRLRNRVYASLHAGAQSEWC